MIQLQCRPKGQPKAPWKDAHCYENENDAGYFLAWAYLNSRFDYREKPQDPRKQNSSDFHGL